jgi:hypothetical protein
MPNEELTLPVGIRYYFVYNTHDIVVILSKMVENELAPTEIITNKGNANM